jgi:hypothetical protein
MLKNIIEQAQKDWEYHFFMFYCKVLFPFSFAKHFRIVTVDKGIVTRIEVRHFKNDKNPDLWYIHINLLKPWAWLEKFLRKTNKHRKPNFAYHISWPKNSLAYKAVTFVNDNYLKYPHIYDYNFFVWPNCNTFIQRILNHIPEVKFKLPRNAIGKNHK